MTEIFKDIKFSLKNILFLLLAIFLTACPYGTVKQNFLFLFKKGSSKNSYECRASESVDEKSLS